MRRHYSVLFLLTLLFAAPGIMAYLCYQHPNWLLLTKINKGTLINPPVLLNELGKVNDPTKAKWQLILSAEGACTKKCQKQLDKLARIRLALGRRLYEVEIILLMKDPSRVPATLMQALLERDIKIKKWTTSDIVLEGPPEDSHIFLANPDNYLVLSYRAKVQPGDIYHDLKQLLKS